MKPINHGVLSGTVFFMFPDDTDERYPYCVCVKLKSLEELAPGVSPDSPNNRKENSECRMFRKQCDNDEERREFLESISEGDQIEIKYKLFSLEDHNDSDRAKEVMIIKSIKKW